MRMIVRSAVDRRTIAVAGVEIVGARVVPRARADEDTVHEPTGSVVAIGSTGVRVIVVVAIGADGSGADASDHWTDTNADRHLGIRTCCDSEEQNCQKSNVF